MDKDSELTVNERVRKISDELFDGNVTKMALALQACT
jgi:hypothetical protein